MALQKCGLNLNRAQKELQPHGTFEFPCAGYSAQYTSNIENVIPWHWHEEIEIAYLKSGLLKLQVPAKTYYLKSGDCIAINSNILHHAAANPQCELQSLVFSPLLIIGTNDSVFAKKYITPLISNTSFAGYLLNETDSGNAVNDFIAAFEALHKDAVNSEFIVREKLSNICVYLYHQFEHEIVTEDVEFNLDNIRIGKMLDYIHMNFSNNLTLSEIARVVDIGERECLRCFQRTIQLPPMQYLLKYRIMQGASLLLNNSANSIAEISTFCGFDSPSNFSKMFKRFYKCTPRGYRNNNIKNPRQGNGDW